MDVGNLQGLIPISGGIYGFLLANGTLPKSPKEPKKMELWRKKFGPMMKIICPLIIVFGLLELIGVL
jgi:hypothetical protein